MSISSRTPEGIPSECPLCGVQNTLEFSTPAADATCPKCRCLIWASAQHLSRIIAYLEQVLGNPPDTLTAATRFSALTKDSIDQVELLLQLESEFDLAAPAEQSIELYTIGDFVRRIQ